MDWVEKTTPSQCWQHAPWAGILNNGIEKASVFPVFCFFVLWDMSKQQHLLIGQPH